MRSLKSIITSKKIIIIVLIIFINDIIRYIVWQEVFDNEVKLDKEKTIVHIWKGNSDLERSKITKNGYKVIFSSCWYLDLIQYGSNWINYYNCDPQDFDGEFNTISY